MLFGGSDLWAPPVLADAQLLLRESSLGHGKGEPSLPTRRGPVAVERVVWVPFTHPTRPECARKHRQAILVGTAEPQSNGGNFVALGGEWYMLSGLAVCLDRSSWANTAVLQAAELASQRGQPASSERRPVWWAERGGGADIRESLLWRFVHG